MSQTALHSQVVCFVGGTGPATGAQQHLQWFDLACRGRIFSATAQGFLQVPDLRTSPQD